MKILRRKNFSSSTGFRVSRLETLAGSKELGADGGSSRKFVTDDGYEFDDPVITHWKGSKIVGFTDRKTGKIIKDPTARLEQELEKIKKNKNFSNTAQKKLRESFDLGTGKEALKRGSNTTFIFESEIGGPDASVRRAGREFNSDVFKKHPGEKGKTILIKDGPEVLGKGLTVNDKINARSIAKGNSYMTCGYKTGKMGHVSRVARKIKR